MAEYPPPVEPSTGRWTALAPALRSRNFRLFWIGQSVSTMGTFLQVVAESWLIYQITGSTLWLGVLGVVGLLPVVPIAFLGGVLVDRMPRRKLIMVTQIGLLAQAAVFGLLVVTGQIGVWHIIILDFIMGALFAIDQPARQAFLVELVSADDLANAIALNSAVFQLSRVAGQAAAGILIATIGAGGTMLLNAATFLAPIIALSMIRVKDVSYDTAQESLRIALSEGVTTLYRRPALLGTISLMLTVGGLPLAISLMMPAFAEDVLGTGAMGLGLLLAAGAVGAVLSTLLVARVRVGRRGRAVLVSSLTLPLFLVAFAVSPSIPVACLVLLFVGLIHSVLHAMSTTLVQVNVPDRVRGRVMSLYGMLIIGVPKLTGVLIGGLALNLGLPLTIGLSSMLALFYALGLHILMPSVRNLD
ncbi:MFS transporter [Chloroflexota bacterium]